MNDKEIERLIEALRSSQNQDARRQAADRLGDIARGNENAIAALTELLDTNKYWYTVAM